MRPTASRALCVALLLASQSLLADSLLLTSGERLSGRIVSDLDGVIVFESEALGKVTIPRAKITRIEVAVRTDEVPPTPLPEPVPAAPGTAAPALPDRTASELPQDKPAPPSAPPPEKREDLLRLWVDQGLRYQIVQPIEVYRPFADDEKLVGEEVRVTGRIGIRVSLDATGFGTSNGAAAIPGDATVRAFRLYTTGNWSPTTSFAVQFGSVSGTFYLHEAYLRSREVPYFSNVNFGYIAVAQTLENMLSFGGSTFMEPALPVLAFAPGNRMGITADRPLWGGRGSLLYGFYSVGADPGLNFGEATQSLLRPTVRLTGLPIADENEAREQRLLHVGLSASLNIARQSTVRYRARPESFVAPFLVDTDVLDSIGARFLGAEALWLQGPFSLQGEAMVNHTESSDSSPHDFSGAYAAASWMLTGEERTYNRTAGVPERMIPNREFSPKAGTWGAWQLGLRMSYLDLMSGTVNGGRVLETTAGVNWWWNRYLRWQLNYHYAVVNGGLTPGHVQILQARVQLMY